MIKMKCKQKIFNGLTKRKRRCKLEARIKGYCIRHLNIHKKTISRKRAENLMNIKKEREELMRKYNPIVRERGGV